VLDTRADGLLKLARTGGDGGCSWPRIPRAWVVTVIENPTLAAQPTTGTSTRKITEKAL
jgi:hypothetical protein